MEAQKNTTEMSEIQKRFRQALARLDIPLSEMAEKVGEKYYTFLSRTKNMIYADTYIELQELYPTINWHYVITGNGKLENDDMPAILREKLKEKKGSFIVLKSLLQNPNSDKDAVLIATKNVLEAMEDIMF